LYSEQKEVPITPAPASLIKEREEKEELIPGSDSFMA
jgi:hypothetical protein